MKTKKIFQRLFIHLILIMGSVVFLYPIIYAISVALMTDKTFALHPPTLIPFPAEPVLTNLKRLFLGVGDKNIKFYFLNSTLRTMWYVGIALASSLVGGYVFGRMKFRGRNFIFYMLLASVMLPRVISLVPTYVMMARFPLVGGNNILGQGGNGFIDKFSVLFILQLINYLGIFLVRQSMLSSPIELEEAARVDGAGILQIIFKIVGPINKPILAYIGIITGLAIWNDWFIPFLYIRNDRYQVLASAISRMTAVATGQYGIPDWPWIITLGLGLTFPVLILFIFFQRHIVEGLKSAAVKG